MKCLLTINAGPSSVEAAVFRSESLERLATLAVTKIGRSAAMTATFGAIRDTETSVDAVDLDSALAVVFAACKRRLGALEWCAVGHRVAHGRHYLVPQVVNDGVRAELEALVPFAPLHQPHNLAGVSAAARFAPSAIQVACFDTSFHRSISDVARRYALPHEISARGIEAYGFHGLSYEYIAAVLPDYLGELADGRVIVAHLGSEASICAMRLRKSVATTMGLTPLDGLPMGTCAGALDPGVILYLLETCNMSVEEVHDLLYLRSGLLGVSGISDRMEDLVASSNRRAAEAIELFVYRAACAIGSLAVSLGGLDAIVFTGGIGENSAATRSAIAHKLAWLGVAVDDRSNAVGRSDFSAPTSAIALRTIRTNEELVIARHLADVLDDH